MISRLRHYIFVYGGINAPELYELTINEESELMLSLSDKLKNGDFTFKDAVNEMIGTLQAEKIVV